MKSIYVIFILLLLDYFSGYSQHNEKHISDTALIFTEERDSEIFRQFDPQNISFETVSKVTIKSKEITSLPVMNFAESLKGFIPGADIYHTDYMPGTGVDVCIRGHKILFTFNQWGFGTTHVSDRFAFLPVFVIDGIPKYTGIDDINPFDIDSIVVLKDAVAGSGYEFRNPNGVISVITKKGTIGKPVINYHGYFGIQKPVRLLDIYNGAEFAELNRDAYRTTNQYSTLYPNPVDDYAIFGADSIAWESIAMAYEWEERDNLVPKTDENDRPVYHPELVRSTCWPELIIRNGLIYNHHLSISGGIKKTKLYFSAGYYSNQGIIRGQDIQRTTLRLNVDQKLFKTIDMGLSLTGSFINQDRGANLYAMTAITSPLLLPYDNNGKLYPTAGGTYMENPLLYLENLTNKTEKSDYNGNVYLNIHVLKNLLYRIQFGVYDENRKLYYNDKVPYLVHDWLIREDHNDSINIYLSFNQSLSYQKKFNNHLLNISISQEKYRYQTDSKYVRSEIDNNIQHAEPVETHIYSVKYRDNLFQGNIGYSFDNKYFVLLNGTSGPDLTLFGSDKIVFNTSYGLAWLINRENFWPEWESINQMKIRISYSHKNKYNRSEPTSNNFPEIHMSHLNTGIDFLIFQNRINGSVDFYNILSDNYTYLPSMYPYPPKKTPLAKIRNRGIELSLKTLNLNRRHFKWHTQLNYYRNREEIISLYGIKEDYKSNSWFIGYPVSVYFDFIYDRILQMNESAYGAPFGIVPGDIVIKDCDKNGLINLFDYDIIGSPNPKWIAGAESVFHYKNFEFSFFLYARMGQILNSSVYRAFLNGRYNERKVNYWTPQNTGGNYPHPRNDMMCPYYISALQYQKGSYIRMKNITLSYDFDERIARRIKTREIRLYFTAYNPFIITGFKGLDPEGATGYQNPNFITCIIGINLSL